MFSLRLIWYLVKENQRIADVRDNGDGQQHNDNVSGEKPFELAIGQSLTVL